MYYAKPDAGINGSYEHHINECYIILEKIFKDRSKSILTLCSSFKINIEDFKQKCCLTILLHDSGKLIPPFQSLMKIIIDNKEPSNKQQFYFRHEIWSAICFLFVKYRVIQDNMDNCPFPYEVFAVLGHHKPLDIQWESFKKERDWQFGCWPTLDQETYEYIMNFVRDKYAKIDDYKAKEADRYFRNYCSNKLFFRLDEFCKPTFLHNKEINKTATRQLYSIIKGMLHFCDWLASSGKKINELNETSDGLQNKIRLKVLSEGKVYEERPFHIKCCKEVNDIIAIAPTGSGKTEAALLWALNQEYKKIIFLMPTMVTSNSLFERMSKFYFNQEICGLSHSGAETYFILTNENKNEVNNEIHFELLQNKAFMPPVMIATVDQLLSTGFNVGLWTHKEFALLGSSVIFDEIHAYDTYTLALITETIKKIKLLGGRVMLMSATMPSFLLHHFCTVLKIDKPIIADEQMNIARNHWQYRDLTLDELDDEIIQHIESNKKIAIVVNDTETAKKTYLKWRKKYGDKVMCYHSQFIMLDRNKKEKILTDPQNNQIQLLISTQAIEVSLDISFDIMISECAPLDSLIQRAGRCNRYGKNKDSKFIIFNSSEISRNLVYKNSKQVLNRTEQIIKNNQRSLTEKEIANMLEDVYSNFELFDDNYHQGETLYKEIAQQCFIFDVNISEEKTRIFEYAKTSIIPEQFYDEVISLCNQKRFKEVKLYEVPVGIGIFNKYIKNGIISNEYNLPIFKVKYSEEIGIIKEFDTPSIW